ncbi:MAG: RNA polymerase subunit sigma, partial [Planctomycetaceae bacterium]|nr:RNA polymerase subunit sigma [Planctomycetaceae bacterium]
FAGLNEQEAADALGISRASAARDWTFAKAWLFARLGDVDAI